MSQIVIEYNGSDYVLEFDRASAMKAEKAYGLSLEELTTGRSYVLVNLFRSAFLKNHSKMQVSVIDSLYEDIEDKMGLYEALSGMYAEVVNETLAEPKEPGKAIGWKKV